MTAHVASGGGATNAKIRIAKRYLAAIAEYEADQTLEAVMARDADNLECLVQAGEYRHQGIDNVQRSIDSSCAALKAASTFDTCAKPLHIIHGGR